MSDYICRIRSNFVRVKDEQAFRDFLERFDCWLSRDPKDGRVGLFCLESVGTPFRHDGEPLVDCVEEICEHLCEGEVLIIEEVGYQENFPFAHLAGVAYAYNHKGECLFVDMASALREKVAAEWGVHDVSDASY
jgi:hypothetical protein